MHARYLILILLVAAILRFAAMAVIPPGLDWDEAAVGYNAYSLLKTGRDEYGTFWPLLFRSFDDYKLPAIVYLTVPSVALFGLNAFAVRFPSALLGVASVGLVYILAKEITGKRKVALLASLLMAISSWHLHFSRVGFEPNVAFFFVLLGITFILRRGDSMTGWLFGAASFALSLYSYHATKIIVPLLLPLLIWYKAGGPKSRGTQYIAMVITGVSVLFALTLPLLLVSTSKESQSRLAQTGFVNHPTIIESLNQKIGEDRLGKGILPALWHNRLQAYGEAFINRYLAHLSPQFLVGGEQLNFRLGLKDAGKLSLPTFFFLAWGLFRLGRLGRRKAALLLSWLGIGLLPGAVGVEYPHALRALNAVAPMTIVAAWGLWCIAEAARRRWRFIALAKFGLTPAVLTAVVAFSTVQYLHEYYVHFPLYGGFDWQASHREMVQEVERQRIHFDRVVVSTKFFRPHIFYAFYTKMDPGSYQTQVGDNLDVVRLYNIEFRRIEWLADQEHTNTLLVATETDVPKGVEVITTIHFPDGGEAFRFIAL